MTLTSIEKELLLLIVVNLNFIYESRTRHFCSGLCITKRHYQTTKKQSIEKDTFKGKRDITWIGKEFTQRTLKVATNN